MNTVQRAQAWLGIYGDVSCFQEAKKVITALLAEREVLLDAVKDSLSGYKYIEEVHGKLYGIGFERAIEKCEKAIQLCEESK